MSNNSLDIYGPKEGLPEFPASKDLKVLLSDNWKQQEENANTFWSDSLQCIHVFETYIKYWEDIRGPYEKLLLPIKKAWVEEISKNY